MTLHAQFQRADREEWLPFFAAAARRYAVRPEILMGIASRETDMAGQGTASGSFKWLEQAGDGGHGYGLMQVDVNSFPDWVATGAWRKAEAGIYQGAAILGAKRDNLLRRTGQTVSVRERTGTRASFLFVMPTFDDPELLERTAISSYNCGDWAPYHLTRGRDVDHGTTRRDYSRDVLSRARLFRGWLATVPDGRVG